RRRRGSGWPGAARGAGAGSGSASRSAGRGRSTRQRSPSTSGTSLGRLVERGEELGDGLVRDAGGAELLPDAAVPCPDRGVSVLVEAADLRRLVRVVGPSCRAAALQPVVDRRSRLGRSVLGGSFEGLGVRHAHAGSFDPGTGVTIGWV